MDDKNRKYMVEGLVFHDEEMAQIATREHEGIRYIRSKTDMDNAEMVLQLYNKIIDQKLFETFIGMSFLRELQDYLKLVPYIDDEDIKPINIEDFIHGDKEEEKKESLKEEKIRKAKAKEQAKLKAKSQNITKIKNQLRWSEIFNVVLALVIIALFVIAMTGDNPNILNYKNNLLNEYAGWEQELTDREEQIRLKEKELNIVP